MLSAPAPPLSVLLTELPTKVLLRLFPVPPTTLALLPQINHSAFPASVAKFTFAKTESSPSLAFSITASVVLSTI